MGKVTVIPPIIISKWCKVNTWNLRTAWHQWQKDNQPSQSDDEVSLNVLSSSNNIFLALKKKQKDLIMTADNLKWLESTIITPVLSMAQIQAKCRVASTRRVFSWLESCGHVLLSNLEPCLPFRTFCKPVYFTLIFHLLVLVACHVYCFGWVCSLYL